MFCFKWVKLTNVYKKTSTKIFYTVVLLARFKIILNSLFRQLFKRLIVLKLIFIVFLGKTYIFFVSLCAYSI